MIISWLKNIFAKEPTKPKYKIKYREKDNRWVVYRYSLDYGMYLPIEAYKKQYDAEQFVIRRNRYD